MKNEFYGRENEKKKLHQMLQREGLQTGLIYGRRRVGKSELIKNVMKESSLPGIYYECKQTSEMNNVDSLASLLADYYHFPKPSFESMEELLDYLFRKSTQETLILVIDEYPYLRKVVQGMDSILQGLIDHYKDSADIKLILCGSYVDVMKSLLMSSDPLYGRVDLTINLQPMDYYDSSLFYSSFSNEDKVRLYSVFGGIPYYNRLIDSSLSVKENLIELIASTGARLENEVPMYLKSEILKITNANEVFEALAKGYSHYSDILAQSHVSSGPTMVDVLDKLMRMEVVDRKAPINDERSRKKMTYLITDKLSLFYYRYIFRYASQMRFMDPEVFFERYIENDFETEYVPHIFEEVVSQFLIRQNRKGKLPVMFEKIGSYWYDDAENKSNGEFDVVTQDPNGYIFYEAKFRKTPVSSEMIAEEIEQVKKTSLSCYQYGFISRSGFDTKPGKNMIFYTLDDLYKADI